MPYVCVSVQSASPDSHVDTAAAPSGVSVIVPVLNEAERLPSLLDGLERHGFEQLIFVDGGSSDGSVDVLKAHSCGGQVIASRPGRALQMNAGASAARYNTLLFVHADTLLPATARDELCKVKHWGRFDVSFDNCSGVMRVIAFFINQRSRLSGVATGDQAIFVGRALFESIDGFNEIPLMEDVDLCKRLKRLHKPYCSREKVITSARRWNENGVLKTVLLMWCFRLAFFVGVPARRLKRFYDDVR